MEADVWVASLTAVLGISAFSLAGAVGLVVRSDTLKGAVFFLVAFAAGALLGDAFFHLIPEIAESESGFDMTASTWLLAGVVAFFVLEKILHWHHAHFPGEEVLHPVAVTNVVGDAVHNFIDGAIVAGSFGVSPQLGVATTVAVALHELPQEIGDFGILVHAGLSPKRALALNFFSALVAVAGAIFVLQFASTEIVGRVFLPFSAGAFIYIASTDLLPDLHKEAEPKRSAVQLVALLAGAGAMAALLVLE